MPNRTLAVALLALALTVVIVALAPTIPVRDDCAAAAWSTVVTRGE